MRIEHPIPPVWDAHSRVLILGSFPSVKSRETAFFYGHPQNRFWRVLAAAYSEPVPQLVAEKTAFLLAHGIALWDVIASCEIAGSSDASIRRVVPNDLTEILAGSKITAVFTNGQTAGRLYRRYLEKPTGRTAVCLPSTSPANAAWSTARLIASWRVVAEETEKTENIT